MVLALPSMTLPSWTVRAREAPSFAGVAGPDLDRLFTGATLNTYRDEQEIFARGDSASTVCLLLGGTVRISTLGGSGKRVTAEIFQPVDLFGEIAAIDASARTADAAAMGPVELVAIPAAAFRAVLCSSAPLANNMLRLALKRWRRTYSLLEDASLRPVELRLAKQVLYLAKLGATGDTHVRIKTRMHQDELADLLGVTTRSIINVLNKWRSDNIVAFDGHKAQLTILDMVRFRALIRE